MRRKTGWILQTSVVWWAERNSPLGPAMPLFGVICKPVAEHRMRNFECAAILIIPASYLQVGRSLAPAIEEAYAQSKKGAGRLSSALGRAGRDVSHAGCWLGWRRPV